MENNPSVILIAIIPLTTALVVEAPTAEAPSLVCIPEIHPMAETINPKVKDFKNPPKTSVYFTDEVAWFMNVTRGYPKLMMTILDPNSPKKIIKIDNKGEIISPAMIRGKTR